MSNRAMAIQQIIQRTQLIHLLTTLIHQHRASHVVILMPVAVPSLDIISGKRRLRYNDLPFKNQDKCRSRDLATHGNSPWELAFMPSCFRTAFSVLRVILFEPSRLKHSLNRCLERIASDRDAVSNCHRLTCGKLIAKQRSLYVRRLLKPTRSLQVRCIPSSNLSASI